MSELVPFNPKNLLTNSEYKKIGELSWDEKLSQEFLKDDILRTSLEEEIWWYFVKHGLTDENINKQKTSDVYLLYLRICEKYKKIDPNSPIRTVDELRKIYENTNLKEKTTTENETPEKKEETKIPIWIVEVWSWEWIYAISQKISKEIWEKFLLADDSQKLSLSQDIDTFLKSFYKKFKPFATGDIIKIYDDKIIYTRNKDNRRELPEVYYEFNFKNKLTQKDWSVSATTSKNNSTKEEAAKVEIPADAEAPKENNVKTDVLAGAWAIKEGSSKIVDSSDKEASKEEPKTSSFKVKDFLKEQPQSKVFSPEEMVLWNISELDKNTELDKKYKQFKDSFEGGSKNLDKSNKESSENTEKPDPKVKEIFLSYYKYSKRTVSFYQKTPEWKDQKVNIFEKWTLVNEAEFDKMLVAVKDTYNKIWFKNITLYDVYSLILVESAWFDPLSTSPDFYSRWLMQISNSAVVDMGKDRIDMFKNESRNELTYKDAYVDKKTKKHRLLKDYIAYWDAKKTHPIYNYKDNLILWMSYLKWIEWEFTPSKNTLNKIKNNKSVIKKFLSRHFNIEDAKFEEIFNKVFSDPEYQKKYLTFCRYNWYRKNIWNWIERKYGYGFWILYGSEWVLGNAYRFPWTEKMDFNLDTKSEEYDDKSHSYQEPSVEFLKKKATEEKIQELWEQPTQPDLQPRPSEQSKSADVEIALAPVPKKEEEFKEKIDTKNVLDMTAVFGDSITTGYWPKLFKFGLKQQNYSAKKWISSTAVLNNVKSYLNKNPNPDLKYAFLAAWANNPSTAIPDIQEAKRLLNQKWIKVIILTYASTRWDIVSLNNQIRDQFWNDVFDIEKEMRWWNLENPLIEWYWEKDGVHLTQKWYGKQAEIIENYLKNQ